MQNNSSFDSIKTFIRNGLSDTFVKNNLIFFTGSLFVSFLNYLYHPVIGRLLSVEDFGEVQAMISLFMQLTIITSVFGMIIVNIVSNKRDSDKKFIIYELQRVALTITVIAFVIMVMLSGYLEKTLHFTSFVPFIILALLLPLGTTIGFRQSYLQGSHKFKEVSIINVLTSALKLFFSIGFVLLGFKSAGAIGGILMAQIITLFYSIKKTSNELPLVKPDIPFFVKNKKIEKEEIKNELIYGGYILIMLLSITVLYTFDVLIVKKFFSPTDAGLYSGIATIARIVFFATGSVAGVLLPSIKIENSTVDNKIILIRSMLIIAGISLPALIMFSTFPKLIITILLGSKYLTYSYLLPLLTLSITLTSIINLLFYYFIALREYKIAPIGIASIVLVLLSSWLNHDKISSVVTNYLLINSLILLTLIFWSFFKKEKKNGEK